MSRIAAAALVLAALASAPPAQAEQPAGLLHAWASAHMTGGADRAARLYTSNARVWSVAAPREWVGHADIGHYLSIFPLGPSRPEFRIEEYGLQTVGEGVVIATGRYTVTREQWGGGAVEEPCRFSLTMVQDETGVWRIAEQHSSALPR
jgi:hypothetical protein